MVLVVSLQKAVCIPPRPPQNFRGPRTSDEERLSPRRDDPKRQGGLSVSHFTAVEETRAERFAMRLRVQLGLQKPEWIHPPLFPGKPGPEQVPLTAEFIHDKEPIPFSEIRCRRRRKIVPGTRWGGDWESAWFFLKGRIPREWRGKEVIFRVSTDSEACIFDERGRPLQGLGVFRDDFPAASPARGGEKVSLLVEAAANVQQGYKADCVFKYAVLEIFRSDRRQLQLDVDFLLALMKCLPKDDTRRARILRGLNRAADLYGAGSPEEVRACRRITKELLAVPAGPTAFRVSALGHAHIDTAWLWPLRETIRKCARTFSTVLRYMELYPQYRFGAAQPQQYQFVKEHYPSLFREIKGAVRSGRWEPQGAMWVEPDCNIPSGESFVRQLLYGKRFFEREFGVNVNHLWLPDVFGYSAALPQLLKQSETDYFVTTKIQWNKINKFPFKSFWWEGLDGSRVFAHFPKSYNGSTAPVELRNAEKEFPEKDRASSLLYLFGYGDGGGGPTKTHIENIRRAADTKGLPRVKFERAGDFLTRAAAECDDWPCWRGELYLETHRGTFTTQAWLKKANRRLEEAFRRVEFLAALGEPRRYPARELERVWKVLLLNQFHDVLPGSSITWVYDDSRRQLAEVEATLRRLEREAAARLSARTTLSESPAEGARPVLVVNPLPWARTELTEIPLRPDEKTPWLAAPRDDSFRPEFSSATVVGRGSDRRALAPLRLPSMGWTVIWVCKKPPEKTTAEVTASPATPENGGLKVSPRLLENEVLRLRFNARGDLISVYDKEHRREVLEKGQVGNALALYEDFPNDYDAWDIDVFYENNLPERARCVKTTVAERGPFRAALRQERRVGASKVVQEICLSAAGRKIEFRTVVDWRENHRMLRAEFPLAVRADRAAYEIQFGHLHRPTHRNTSWDAARWEVCGHRWADLSESGYGAALLNDCKYGYKALGNSLSLTLLRAPKFPDPQADRGRHEFIYALYPHAGTLQEAGVVRAARELNEPAAVFDFLAGERRRKSRAGNSSAALPATFSFVAADKENVVVETVKKAEDSDAVIVRLYEAHGARGPTRLRFGRPVKQAAECNLLERKDRPLKPRPDGSLRLVLRPFQVVTLKLQFAEEKAAGRNKKRSL